MSEMNDKHIDELARLAAQNSVPQFSEAAWDKMNAMLDKEFKPEKKRRFAFWWWLPAALLVGGIGYYFVNNSSKKDKEFQAINNKITHSENTEIESSKIHQSTVTNEQKISVQDENKVSTSNTTAKTSIHQNKKTSSFSNGGKNNITTSAVINNNQNHQQVSENAVEQKSAEKEKVFAEHDHNKQEVIQQTQNNNNLQGAVVMNELESKPKSTEPSSTTNTSTSQNSTAKKENKIPSRWSAIGSLAIDASFVDISSIEKAALNYGAGVNFSINKKFSLSTGVYAGHKIYTAQKEDYHYKTIPGYYNYIKKIDADCYVIELPISVRYNISTAKNHTWFTTAGVSSLIMKSEDYNTLADYGGGSIMWHPYSVTNENKHLFSTATISVGYEFALKNKQSFIAIEPYYKLPLKGVGEGSVELSSIGIQTSFRFNFLKQSKPTKK